MLLLDGKIVRDSRVSELKRQIRALGFTPRLAIIQIGTSDRSHAYVKAKQKFAETVGVEVELVTFSGDISPVEIHADIERLNADPSINGIIMQLPTPRGIDHRPLVEAIAPAKDVDGLTAYNLKLLLENNRSGFVPATARGIISLLDFYSVPLEGKRVVIVGRSLLVGKPTALSFLNRNATVTICHSFTRDLGAITKEAEILVIAVGIKRLIGKEHVSKGQIVVDVGINLEDGEHLAEEIAAPKLVGDVDFDAVQGIVSAVSPVPGGVGPMTVLSLFENVLEAAGRQSRASH